MIAICRTQVFLKIRQLNFSIFNWQYNYSTTLTFNSSFKIINDNLIYDQLANDFAADQEADDGASITKIKTNFNGMKICEEIGPRQQDSYFKVQINGVKKYIHKQSACWLLTERNIHLSNDRLSRVIQTSRRDNENVF
jgi:hypothetical protein